MKNIILHTSAELYRKNAPIMDVLSVAETERG